MKPLTEIGAMTHMEDPAPTTTAPAADQPPAPLAPDAEQSTGVTFPGSVSGLDAESSSERMRRAVEAGEPSPADLPRPKWPESVQRLVAATDKLALPALAVGRIVHYVLSTADLGSGHQRVAGEHRPAIVVKVWTSTCANLQVFTDSANDGLSGTLWATSKVEDVNGAQGTWHWPERQG